jgi:peptidoglycan/LPS O-acetylase OafA/YrhL
MTATLAKPVHLPALDGWRAVAILMVILCHSADQWQSVSSIFSPHLSSAFFQTMGVHGVRVFFALSGFLITWRLLEERSLSGGVSLPNFYIRRVARIIPPALAYLLVVGLLAVCGVLDVSPTRWLAALFFFANYLKQDPSWYLGHFWSLAVEEHFYIIWPSLFVMAVSMRSKVLLLSGLIGVLSIWRAVAFKFGITYEVPAQFWGRTDIVADGLMYGALGAILYRKLYESGTSSPLLKILSRDGVVAFCFIWPIVVAVADIGGWKADMFIRCATAMSFAAMVVGSVASAMEKRSALLDAPVLVYVGRLSYSLYLWQQLFFAPAVHQSPYLAPLQSLPVSLVLAFTCAWLSHRYIEMPFVNFGKRFLVKTF